MIPGFSELFLYYRNLSVIEAGMIALQFSFGVNVNIRLYCYTSISGICVNSSSCWVVYVNSMVTHAPTLTHISVKREAHVSLLTCFLVSCIETGSFSLPVSATVIVPPTSKYWPPTAVQMLPDFPMCLGTRVTSQRSKQGHGHGKALLAPQNLTPRAHRYRSCCSFSQMLAKKRWGIRLNATSSVRGDDTLH